MQKGYILVSSTTTRIITRTHFTPILCYPKVGQFIPNQIYCYKPKLAHFANYNTQKFTNKYFTKGILVLFNNSPLIRLVK